MAIDPEGKESRVQQLLEEESPLPQKEIVSETGWSQSLTSQLLSRMEEEGEIYRYRRGRENYICDPDDKPGYLE